MNNDHTYDHPYTFPKPLGWSHLFPSKRASWGSQSQAATLETLYPPLSLSHKVLSEGNSKLFSEHRLPELVHLILTSTTENDDLTLIMQIRKKKKRISQVKMPCPRSQELASYGSKLSCLEKCQSLSPQLESLLRYTPPEWASRNMTLHLPISCVWMLGHTHVRLFLSELWL